MIVNYYYTTKEAYELLKINRQKFILETHKIGVKPSHSKNIQNFYSKKDIDKMQKVLIERGFLIYESKL